MYLAQGAELNASGQYDRYVLWNLVRALTHSLVLYVDVNDFQCIGCSE